jgi:hypothetical protein
MQRSLRAPLLEPTVAKGPHLRKQFLAGRALLVEARHLEAAARARRPAAEDKIGCARTAGVADGFDPRHGGRPDRVDLRWRRGGTRSLLGEREAIEQMGFGRRGWWRLHGRRRWGR